MKELVETFRGIVYLSETDHMGHMNVQWYTRKFDEATWHLFGMVGITPSYIRNNNRGMVAVQQNTKYLRELLAGDLVVVKTGVIEVKEKSIRFFHKMFNAENCEECATTELVGVHIDRGSRKSCRFPEEIFKRGMEMVCLSKSPEEQ